eukprot:TRINITY_DN931_c0_g1_i9.p1 TRINITY_DN931_c0_g1~~TRINITY_DN931_c0_g1_i9.p1  ORF type:complete len:286 (+),score=26.87 TRINITY_DN931_c0_g1_i9:152-1009(+)
MSTGNSGDSTTNDSKRTHQRLEGKVALITGGATGIGESIARLFRLNGAKVCVADVQDDLGMHVCESLGGAPNAYFIHCDVTAEDDVLHAVDFTVEKYSTLDIMVNNAGISGPAGGDICNVDLADFQKVFDVNVNGVFHGMKHAARVMIPRRKGSILSIGSVASVTGGLGPHAYTGSKHAVLGLTKNVAAELGAHGIRVNCVSPYAVPTNLAFPHLPEGERREDLLKSFTEFTEKQGNLWGANLMPDDVAEAVVYLASEEARYISGINLMVDGGFTCVNHSLKVFR